MFRLTLMVLAISGAVAGTATAGMIGTNITGEWVDGSSVLAGPATATVGDGVEFPHAFSGADIWSIDVTDTSIIIDDHWPGDPFSGGQFNGLVFNDASIDFTDVTIDSSAGGYADFNSSRILFSGSTVSIDFQGLSHSGSELILDITSTSSSAPEPGSAMLLAAAAVPLMMWTRKNRRNSPAE